jgi:hypothetical protein
MGRPRSLVLAVLLYISVDLSLASMPGAFVFEAGDSVESIQLSRARPLNETATVLISAPTPKLVVDIRPLPMRRPVPPPARRDERSPSAGSKSPPPSEDPH